MSWVFIWDNQGEQKEIFHSQSPWSEFWALFLKSISKGFCGGDWSVFYFSCLKLILEKVILSITPFSTFLPAQVPFVMVCNR